MFPLCNQIQSVNSAAINRIENVLNTVRTNLDSEFNSCKSTI